MDSLVCVVRVPNLSHNSLFKDRYDQQGVGGEEEGVLVLRISSDRDDQMGTKIKRKNSLDQNLTPPPPPAKKGKKSHPGIRRNYQESSDCSEYPKEFPTQIKVPKTYLLKFSSQNFKPKQSFDHSRHEIWSTRKGRHIHHLSGIRRYMLGKSYDLKEKDAIK